ncbi:Flp pilus assembly protein CpaB [Streptomyces odontomachi]|uniref:Flp pilus assembly protein CpaB n=1 Tax=Streptomyces odontomachi TaxID=2944940 RepID=UPI002109F7BD|nr:Flp pilus assembly protein CpaB [Streptomyces sp. ODS25]
MNSRQRRGVILLLISVLCAFAAFAGVISVISDVNSKVGPEVSAYELTTDVAPYTALDSGSFKKVSMPKRWLPDTAVTDLSHLNGKIAVTTLRKGSLLQSDMLVNQPELKAGEQEIAIMIDAETGVAGKITPGSTVNIYATFAGRTQNEKAQSRVIVQNARVLEVGKITALEPKKDEPQSEPTQAVPITFALDTLNAQRVAYAESFAEHVRLALVAPGSDTSIPKGDQQYTLDRDK